MTSKITKNSLVMLIMLFSIGLFAQQNRFNYRLEATKTGASLYAINDIMNQEIKSYDMTILENKKHVKQYYRWKHYWNQKINLDGTFPHENLAFFNTGILNEDGSIKKEQPKNNNKSILSTQAWVNINPSTNPAPNGYSNYPQLGRLNTFLRLEGMVEALDVLFVGAPNGGIWKSTNGGFTWTPKSDFLASIGISDIKTSPTTTASNYTTKPIYAATGDYDGGNTKSIGVIKSIDGGETWTSTGLTFGLSANEVTGDLLVIDDNTIIVGTKNTIRKSIDGGTTWTIVYGDETSVNPWRYARFQKNGTNLICVDLFGGIHKSLDNGDNWSSAVANGSSQNKHATYLSTTGNFYVQSQNGQIKQFNFDTNALTNLGTIPAEYNPQGGYNMAFMVEGAKIFMGEFNGGHSLNSGANWYRSLNGYHNGTPEADGTYVHSDHHRMGFIGQHTNNRIWSVNDGGLNYINYNAITTNTKPTDVYKSNGVIVTQSYSIAIANNDSNSNNIMLSNQDNDHYSRTNGSWIAVAGGDGIQSAINYNDTNIRYASGQEGKISMTTTGWVGQYGGNGTEVQIPVNANPGGNPDGFYFPLEMHKTNPNLLYAGGSDGLKRITYNPATPSLTLENIAGTMNFINTIATHANNLLVCNQNSIKKSMDNSNGQNWTSVTNPSGVTAISSLDFKDTDVNILYCTSKGYNTGNKIFKSINGGTSWTNISGTFPDIAIKKILLKKTATAEILFVATELGVYYKYDTQEWTKLGSGLPNVDVRDMEINYVTDKLLIATYGRGSWEINVANSTLGVSDEVTLNDIDFVIYPNPVTNDVLNIKHNHQNKLNYEIYNVVGGIVKKGDLINDNIDVSNLAANVYLIRLFNEKETVTKKFIIN
jgi:xyloglucan-specific exo-beta-1,4-glucanase